VVGERVYGEFGVYNFRTGATSNLPSPVQLPPGCISYTWQGAAPPDGQTYWVPLSTLPIYYGGCLGAPVGFGIYNTASSTLLKWLPVPFANEFASPTPFFTFSPDSSSAYILQRDQIGVFSTETFQQTATFPYQTTFVAL
jgi:hypothetical protein